MKFTEEQAYNELVSKLKALEANPLINERAIKAIISDDFKLFADVDIDLDKYVEVKVNSLKENDGNVRKVVSDSISEIKRKQEEEERNKKGDGEGNKPTPTDDESSQKISALEEKYNALLDKMNKAEKESKEKIILSNLLSKMSELGIKNSKWAEKAVEGLAITEDMDIEAKAKSYLELYNLSMANAGDFTPPAPVGTTKDDDDILESIRKEREQTLKNETI